MGPPPGSSRWSPRFEAHPNPRSTQASCVGAEEFRTEPRSISKPSLHADKLRGGVSALPGPGRWPQRYPHLPAAGFIPVESTFRNRPPHSLRICPPPGSSRWRARFEAHPNPRSTQASCVGAEEFERNHGGYFQTVAPRRQAAWGRVRTARSRPAASALPASARRRVHPGGEHVSRCIQTLAPRRQAAWGRKSSNGTTLYFQTVAPRRQAAWGRVRTSRSRPAEWTYLASTLSPSMAMPLRARTRQATTQPPSKSTALSNKSFQPCCRWTSARCCRGAALLTVQLL